MIFALVTKGYNLECKALPRKKVHLKVKNFLNRKRNFLLRVNPVIKRGIMKMVLRVGQFQSLQI